MGAMATVARIKQRPFERFEHGVQNDEDDENGDGKHDQQALVGSLLAGVFALPVESVPVGNLTCWFTFADRFFHGAAEVASADAVFNGNIAPVAFAINFRSAIGHADFAELSQRYAFARGRQQTNLFDRILACRDIAEDSAAQDRIAPRLEDLSERVSSDRRLNRILDIGDIDLIARGLHRDQRLYSDWAGRERGKPQILDAL